MSTKDMVNGYAEIARSIQQFMWEGKPHKSQKKEHTQEELENKLEEIREWCWGNYDDSAKELGWK